MLRADAFVKPTYTDKQHAMVGKPISRSQLFEWKKHLSRRAIELFEREAGALLCILGYELESSGPLMPPTIVERVTAEVRATLGYVLKRRRYLRRLKESQKV
jgi:hypothetical protein